MDDVGFDLYLVGDHLLPPGTRQDLPTGIAIQMPEAIYGRITGRSSSIRKGLLVHEGIIDPGYRGELLTYVTNLTKQPISLEHGYRIGQLIFGFAVRPVISEAVDGRLSDSARGEKGLGSSGH